MNYPKPAILSSVIPPSTQGPGYNYVPQYKGMSFTLALPRRSIWDEPEENPTMYSNSLFGGKSLKQKILITCLMIVGLVFILHALKHINRR